MSDDDYIPAATLILAREPDAGGAPEYLMVRRHGKMAFAANAWVWPGGRVDAADHEGAADDLDAARIAAVRETREEVDLDIDPATLVPFARWAPKMKLARRFDTWFFLARAPLPDAPLTLQEGEIVEARWTSAQAMLDAIAAGKAGAIFPTKRNLERLARFASIDEAIVDARAQSLDRIVPWVEDRDGQKRVCIPEGRGYPVTSEPLDSAVRA
ncbi:NUDIX hydrolase [Sphingomicrobium clamense]|uniref:NUDIX hydrolase n=1 Tax=Sphingomicrobium clamense TaxID=2851013 RepID=UPI0031F335AB